MLQDTQQTNHKNDMKRENPTRCYTIVYWTYDPLNMFRALLCPSSGAQECTGDYSMWHITLCLKMVRWSGVGLRAIHPGWRVLLDTVRQHPSTQTHSPQPHTRPPDHL